MKKLILVIVILAFILLAAPYVSGKVAETQIHALVSQVPIENGKTEILSYDRRFFSADSTYRYTLPLQYKALFKDLESIDLECAIDHGITGITYDCHVINNQTYSDFISEHLDGNDPIALVGAANAFGMIKNTITIDEVKDFELDSESGLINIADTELTVITDKNLSAYTIEGGTKNFSVVAGAENVNIQNVFLNGDLSRLEQSLFSGDFSFTIDDIELNDGTNEIQISDLSTNTSASEKGKNLDSITEMSIGTMTLANSSFNVADDLQFTARVIGVDKDALIEYQAFSQKLQSQFLDANNTTPTVDPMEMVPIIEKMLTKDFKLGFDLSGQLDNKASSASFDLSLLDLITMSDAMALAYAPQDTLNKLNISLTTSFNQETVQKDPKLAASVINSLLFESSNNEYKMDLKVGPKIELNGNTMTIEELSTIMTNAATPQVQQ